MEVIPTTASRELEEKYAHFLRSENYFLISLSTVLAGVTMWITLRQLENRFKYGMLYFILSVAMEMFFLFFIYGNVWMLRNDDSFS